MIIRVAGSITPCYALFVFWLSIVPSFGLQSVILPNSTVSSIVKRQSHATTQTTEKSCDLGKSEKQCGAHEHCESTSAGSQTGFCECDDGFTRSSIDSLCIAPVLAVVIEGPHSIQLPTRSAVLETKITGYNGDVSNLKYDWTVTKSAKRAKRAPTSTPTTTNPADVTKQPVMSTEDGHYEGKELPTLSLSELSEGDYEVKVLVREPMREGQTAEAKHVLTVKAANKPNVAPTALIKPPKQTVAEKTTVILDGRVSEDPDGSIVQYHWEVQEQPVGYEVPLSDTSELKLEDLKPGNYTFRLTVTDDSGASDSATAVVVVKKDKNYPPKAVAGNCDTPDNPGDVSIHLPVEVLKLCGNQSKDDVAIVEYIWTQSGSQAKPVDLTGSSTPVLELRRLQVGDYTFKLTVKDNSGLSNSATVHVFVLPASHKPPVANAGGNHTVVLPNSEVVLDGSSSSADGQIVAYAWHAVGKQPAETKLINTDKNKMTVQNLKAGVYTFALNVTDDKDLSAVDYAFVTVNRSTNLPPKAVVANATVVIPESNFANLSGAASSDDAGITEYSWRLMPQSVVGLTLLGNSSSSPNLLISNLRPGVYLFNFTVYDAERLFDSKIAKLTVTESSAMKNSIEMYLGDTKFVDFTERMMNRLRTQLASLLASTLEQIDSCVVHITTLAQDFQTGRVYLVFYVTALSTSNPTPTTEPAPSSTSVVSAVQVVDVVRQEGHFLDFKIDLVETKYCHNDCNGHGTCDHYTKNCHCDRYWMPNLIMAYVYPRSQNCAWSILYFSILFSISVILTVAFVWACICAAKRRRKGDLRSKVEPPNRRRRRRRLGDKSSFLRKGVPNGSARYNNTSSDQVVNLLKSSDSSLSDSDNDQLVIFERGTQDSAGQAVGRSNGVAMRMKARA